MGTPTEANHHNFIRTLVQEDLRSGRFATVRTRFPPEPNGYLHIGHAKSICLNFGLAAEFGGTCNLRMDDTNPVKEDAHYVEAMKRDVNWLGFRWDGDLIYTADSFGWMIDVARQLIKDGKAYVCDLDDEAIREWRGTVTEAGRESPGRKRPIAENLELFSEMVEGKHPDGAFTLRARIDMSSPNMKLRDPLLYRIRHVSHHRTGDQFCVYPMYDYAHPLQDALEGITHSICTLEFENNREIYDWVIDNCDRSRFKSRPYQTEFARLFLSYTMMSKRKLLQIVQDKVVAGWDDPRMPTLAGMRRKGVSPAALRTFCEKVGVARANSMVDVEVLDGCVRDDLNAVSPRRMAVLKPLKVVLTNWTGPAEDLEAPDFPPDIGLPGSRQVPFGKVLYIEQDDFSLAPPKGWHRLVAGGVVRLRNAYVIRCDEVIHNEAGEVVELRASVDLGSKSGGQGFGQKPKGIIHWVAADGAVKLPIRWYERLFDAVEPDGAGDWRQALNPRSLTVLEATAEPALGTLEGGQWVQLERHGYFFVDPVDFAEGKRILNLTVALRSGWAKEQEKAAEAAPAPTKAPPAPKVERVREPALVAACAAIAEKYGIGELDAEAFVNDPALHRWLDEAVAAGAPPHAAANWIKTEVARLLKEHDALAFDAKVLAEVIAMVGRNEVNHRGARQVLSELAKVAEAPAAVVARLGLAPVDHSAVEAAVREVIAEQGDKVEAYKAGQLKWFGLFVGEAMKKTRGAADPALVKTLVEAALK